MKKIITIPLFIMVLSGVLYSAINKNVETAGTTGARTITSADTLTSKIYELDDSEYIVLNTNLTGVTGGNDYVFQAIQGYIQGSWVTIATDSAGSGLDSYVFRNGTTVTIPAKQIRILTYPTVSSATLTLYQNITGR